MKAIANKSQQSGAYIVEFAYSIGIFMFLLFAVIETGRILYTWSALTLVTQRGARVAAVCPVHDELIAQIAVFGGSNGNASTIIPGVGADNISVSYLDESGAASVAYENIAYVNVSIINYTHKLLIPLFLNESIARNILAPTFSTTLSVESLGYDPSSESRVCFA